MASLRAPAIGFHSFGGPEVLEILELPVPVPGPQDVIVEVAYATVNHTDLEMRKGTQVAWMSDLTPPFVSGMELAGTVHAVGRDMRNVQVGDPVVAGVNPRRPLGGAHAKFVSVPAESLSIDTTGLHQAHAATLPMNGLTAIWALRLLAIAEGGSLLVTGAAGAVGAYAIELAKREGIEVVANAGAGDRDFVTSLGADHFVARGEDVAAEVLRLFPGGVDGVVDAARLGDSVARAVRSGGTFVALRSEDTVTDPRVTTRCVNVTEALSETESLQLLVDLARSGDLTTRVAHILPFVDAAEACGLVAAGGLRGRVVLDFTTAGKDGSRA